MLQSRAATCNCFKTSLRSLYAVEPSSTLCNHGLFTNQSMMQSLQTQKVARRFEKVMC